MTNPTETARELPAAWPPAVRDAFWTAVNAPTYEESTAATLAFAQMLASSAGVAPATAQTAPSRRAGLRDEIAAALREHGMVHLGDQVPADEYECCADVVLAVLPAPASCPDPIECSHEAALGEARETNRRLNYRAQELESELAAYRRAVAQWEISERRTYVPLRTLAMIAKAAGRDIENPQWLLHYQRVEQAEAAIERVRSVVESEAVRGRSALDFRGLIASALMADGATADRAAESAPADTGHAYSNRDRLAAVQQPKEADGARVVAYFHPDIPNVLLCRIHGNRADLDVMPLASENLPNGGVCTECGVDVLIPQQPKEA